jgi:hypothetical protein
MPTDLQIAYAELRERGRGQSHRGAIRELARRIDVDENTVRRVLDRADKLDRKQPSRRGQSVEGDR